MGQLHSDAPLTLGGRWKVFVICTHLYVPGNLWLMADGKLQVDSLVYQDHGTLDVSLQHLQSHLHPCFEQGLSYYWSFSA